MIHFTQISERMIQIRTLNVFTYHVILFTIHSRTPLNIKKMTWNYYTIMELQTNHYVKGIAVIFMLQFIEMKDLNLNNFTFSHARGHNLCPNVRFFNWRPFNNSFCLRKCNTHPCILWSSGRPLKYIFSQNKNLYIFRNETKNRISNKIRLNNVISFFLFFFFKLFRYWVLSCAANLQDTNLGELVILDSMLLELNVG